MSNDVFFVPLRAQIEKHGTTMGNEKNLVLLWSGGKQSWLGASRGPELAIYNKERDSLDPKFQAPKVSARWRLDF